MLRNVYLKTLRDQRRTLPWWTLGLVGMSLFLMLLYPTIRDSASQLQQYIDRMPDAVRALMGGFTDYTTVPGYLQAELFGFMMPAVFLVFTIGAGSRAIAGEEERRTLDMLMANPIPRHRVVVQKFEALVTGTAVIGAILWIGIALGGAFAGANPPLTGLARQILSLVLLGVAFGSLSLAIGSAGGNRALASGVAGGLAVTTYLVNALAEVVDWLAPYRRLSPFHYYAASDPLTTGLNWAHMGVLAGVSLLMLVLSVAAFQRRDLAA
jgi:ABC-2 type transport system permease protein